jgi:hypothetical protein
LHQAFVKPKTERLRTSSHLKAANVTHNLRMRNLTRREFIRKTGGFAPMISPLDSFLRNMLEPELF